MERVLQVIGKDCVEVVERLIARRWSRRFRLLRVGRVLVGRGRIEEVDGTGWREPAEGLSETVNVSVDREGGTSETEEEYT